MNNAVSVFKSITIAIYVMNKFMIRWDVID